MFMAFEMHFKLLCIIHIFRNIIYISETKDNQIKFKKIQQLFKYIPLMELRKTVNSIRNYLTIFYRKFSLHTYR